MNVAVYTKYRPDVDQYEIVRIHAVEGARTLCGRRIGAFKVWERTNLEVDCISCQAKIDKNKR